MLDEPVLLVLPQPLLGAASKFFRLEAVHLLTLVRIAAKSADPEPAIEPAHRGVGEQRQVREVSLWFFKSGPVDGGVGRGHEGRHRLEAGAGVQRVFFHQKRFAGFRVDTHRQAARQHEDVAALGQGNEVFEAGPGKMAAAAARHVKLGIIRDLACGVGKDQAGGFVWVFAWHYGVLGWNYSGWLFAIS